MDMKTGFIKKWPRLALATAVIGCLLYGGWQLIAVRRQLARYKRDLVAQGAILTSERLAPPFVAPSSNAAPRLADCLARLEKCREIPSHYVALMEPIVPGKAVVSWKSDPPWSDDGIHVSWDTLMEGRRRNEPVLALAREALELPSFNARLDYAGQGNSPEVSWSSIKTCCQWLAVAVACDLHEGNRSNALANLNAGIRCVRLTSQEPLVLCQLLTLLTLPLAAGASWELLQASGWTEAQLAGVQDNWQALDLIGSTIHSLEMERARTCAHIARCRASIADLPWFIGSPGGSGAGGTLARISSGSGRDPFLAAVDQVVGWGRRSFEVSDVAGRCFTWRWYWSYLDENLLLQSTESELQLLRSVQRSVPWQEARGRYREAAEVWDRPLRQHEQVLLFSRQKTRESVENPQPYLRQAETSRQLLISAIALERYRLRRRRYPDELALLVPDFLVRLPRDPIDGQPLRYRLNADGGFTLYSVGDDGVDQGGNAEVPPDKRGSYWLSGRDWVWPSPATAKDLAEAEAKSAGQGKH